MALGPLLIFDKSTLQSLNTDESVWLENFFLHNITPLFFIETLSDLEKEVRSGRTPEQIVGNLALKTPNMSSYPNVHHSELITGELMGAGKVEMSGRVIISGGKPMSLEGKIGIIHKQFPEAEAFNRWQHGEFLDLERQIAKKWRTALAQINYEENLNSFKNIFIGRQTPKNLTEVKSFADEMIDGWDQGAILHFGMDLLGIPLYSQAKVLVRWKAFGCPAIRSFSPYFSYVLSVDLFYYLGTTANLLQFTHPRTHKIDLAYLYYLPFCMVFVSNDKFHEAVAPQFLRKNQTYVEGIKLKEDLGKLDKYYSSLPETVKDRGVMSFASYPPIDGDFLVSQLWDKYLPIWRKRQSERTGAVLDKEIDGKLLKKINRFQKEAVPIKPEVPIDSDKTDHIGFERKARSRKGKWRIFSIDIERAASENL